jgi:signal transduction histidine kinase
MAGSKDAFHRLFGNLISNSLDAYSAREIGRVQKGAGKGLKAEIKNEKEICISAYKNGDFVVITFEDKAGGIPKMIQKYLFKEQYTTKSKGNGLGLISIRALVEEHFHGFLNCFCTKGIGTIFVIALPLSK